ncbi:MAG: tRNA-dihydrouridine synthase [Eubacteriales bacterium]
MNNVKTYLAPMAGYTDHAFRQTCRLLGAGMTYTEMISAKAMHFGDKKTAVLAELFPGEEPIGIQIFGKEPDIMAEAAIMLADGSYNGCASKIRPASIDINMGRPAPRSRITAKAPRF